MPAASTPWREATFTVVDLETDRARPRQRRDHLLRRGHGGERQDSPGRRAVSGHPPASECPTATRSVSTAFARATSSTPRRFGEVIDEVCSRSLTGSALVAHVAAVESGFLDTALETRGLPLRNPVVDTAGLDLELRRLQREPPPAARVGTPRESRSPRRDSRTWRARLACPSIGPHHADGRRPDHRAGVHRARNPSRGSSGRRRSARSCVFHARRADEFRPSGCSADWALAVATPSRSVQDPLHILNLRKSGLTDVRFRT